MVDTGISHGGPSHIRVFDVDGALVGTAALRADEWVALAKAAADPGKHPLEGQDVNSCVVRCQGASVMGTPQGQTELPQDDPSFVYLTIKSRITKVADGKFVGRVALDTGYFQDVEGDDVNALIASMHQIITG